MVKRAQTQTELSGPEPQQPSLVIPLICIIGGFNIGSYYGAFGIGYGIAMAFTFLGVFLALPTKKRSVIAVLTALLGTVASFSISLRANGFVQAMGYVTSLSSLGYLMLLVSAPNIPSTIWEHISQAFLHAVQSLFSPFRLILRSKEQTENDSQKKPLQFIKTAAITIAVFALFAGLLMSADPIFKHMIQQFLD